MLPPYPKQRTVLPLIAACVRRQERDGSGVSGFPALARRATAGQKHSPGLQ